MGAPVFPDLETPPNMQSYFALSALIASAFGAPQHVGVGHGVVHGHVDYHDPIPYSFKYGVSDAHSGANFGHEESEDGGGSRVGTYSVHLPDGRVQHVNYHANDAEGYVAEVVYDGTAHFPEVVGHHGHHGGAGHPAVIG